MEQRSTSDQARGGFVKSLIGVELAEPNPAELEIWKGIYRIRRLNFNFQVTHFYGLDDRMKSWPAGEGAVINTYPSQRPLQC